MEPASRAPEEDPLRCPMCGAWQRIEGSKIPCYSVCTSCGAVAWFVKSDDHRPETRRQIQNLVREVSALGRADLPLKQFGEGLLSRLIGALAAYGGMLWTPNELRDSSAAPTMNLAAYVGATDSPELAQRVAVAKQEIVYTTKIDERETLVIGAPILRADRVVGVIEIFQRVGDSPTVQKGYVRFVIQMGELVAESPTLR